MHALSNSKVNAFLLAACIFAIARLHILTYQYEYSKDAAVSFLATVIYVKFVYKETVFGDTCWSKLSKHWFFYVWTSTLLSRESERYKNKISLLIMKGTVSLTAQRTEITGINRGLTTGRPETCCCCFGHIRTCHLASTPMSFCGKTESLPAASRRQVFDPNSSIMLEVDSYSSQIHLHPDCWSAVGPGG